MITNFFALASFAIRAVGLIILVLYPIPKQFNEVLRPKDNLTVWRWRLLLILIFTALAEVPAITTLWLRSIGITSISLQNKSSLLGAVAFLLMVLGYVTFYNYKHKE